MDREEADEMVKEHFEKLHDVRFSVASSSLLPSVLIWRLVENSTTRPRQAISSLCPTSFEWS